MADVYTRIGYIKGATGAQGAQGAKGDTGDAATIEVGTVTTVPYGQTASVVNSGTSGAAVFDFTIPQGRPGQETTDMQNLVIGAITTSSASFPVPAVGETGKVLWGKVVKWFSDMSALVATKLNVANVVNNLTTTTEGYALDARQGKLLQDRIASINNTLDGFIGSRAFSYAYSVNANSTVTITGDNLDMSIPDGYVPIGMRVLDTGNTFVFPYFYNLAGTGGTTSIFARLHNVSSSTQSGTFTFRIVYVKSDFYKNL